MVLIPALPLAAQLSHPPSRSGWLADDVILGVSFTNLSVKKHQSLVFLQRHSNDTLAAAVLTELKEARVGSWRRVAVSSRGKLAGAGTVRTQQVPNEVGPGGLSRRAEAGADPGARSHPEGVKQVTYSCKTAKRDREKKIGKNPKHFILGAVRKETRTFRVRCGATEENVFLRCCCLTSRWCKQIVEEVAVAGSSFHSTLEPLRGSGGGVCGSLRVRVQPQQVGRITDRGFLGGRRGVLEGGDEERNRNTESES